MLCFQGVRTKADKAPPPCGSLRWDEEGSGRLGRARPQGKMGSQQGRRIQAMRSWTEDGKDVFEWLSFKTCWVDPVYLRRQLKLFTPLQPLKQGKAPCNHRVFSEEKRLCSTMGRRGGMAEQKLEDKRGGKSQDGIIDHFKMPLSFTSTIQAIKHLHSRKYLLCNCGYQNNGHLGPLPF